MKLKSQVFTQASGSIGGITYSHNKGGIYQRARTIPTDPATSRQVVMRNAIATLSNRWSNVLDDTQRNDWATYAANVPVVDTLGDPIFISGIAWYIKANSQRIQASLSIIDDAPSIFTLETLTIPSFTITSVSAPAISVAFTNTDEWAGEVGGALLFWISRPQSVGINFFKGPYRYVSKVVGAATPPTSPTAMASPFTVPAGARFFGKFVAVGSDGRVSGIIRSSAIAA